MQYNQVLNAVANVNGATFIGLDTLTSPKLAGGKKNPHQGRVQKRMTGANVMAFQNKTTNGYENMVKRRLVAEGKNPDNFVLGERAWGQRVPNLPIVEHVKDGVTNYYLEVIFLSSGTVEYLLDGVVVPASSIEGLAEPTEGGAQGGLDDKVVVRTFGIDSITEIRINEQVYN